MNSRQPLWNRPLTLFVLLTGAFAAGIVVERSGRYFTPFQYTPAGLEKTFAPFWETWDLVDKHYVDHEAVKPERMTRGAIEGMLASLGDYGHTTYLSADELKRMESDLEGRLEGIGAVMSFRNRKATVERTIPGSPARAAGLKPGDVIVQVDGQDVSGFSLARVAQLVRGPEGNPVHLRIAREGKDKKIETKDFDIKRSKVEVPDVAWRLLPGTTIAHMAIQNFGLQAHHQLLAALTDVRRRGAKALIVDVRGNPGGLKDQAVAITSEFLTQGDVFLQQDAQGRRTAIAVLPGAHAPDIPLCVLINEGSASSSEIFAGALQDHHRGQLIGMRTFGTGTVLQPFKLHDGSAVLLAIAEWLTPDGHQIWKKGIQPDIRVPLLEGASPIYPDAEANGLAAAGSILAICQCWPGQFAPLGFMIAREQIDAAALAKSEDKQLLKALEVIEKQAH